MIALESAYCKYFVPAISAVLFHFRRQKYDELLFEYNSVAM